MTANIRPALPASDDRQMPVCSYPRTRPTIPRSKLFCSMVQRAAETFAITNNINADPIAASAWETLYWNMANWNEVAP